MGNELFPCNTCGLGVRIGGPNGQCANPNCPSRKGKR